MSKIRRVDWSPDEYIAGTFGELTVEEHGVYNIALNKIYSAGGRMKNDLEIFTKACKGTHWRTLKVALAGLVEKGKLVVSEDGQWLTNERANKELSKARGRIEQAVGAGHEAGKSHTRRAAERRGEGSRPPARPAQEGAQEVRKTPAKPPTGRLQDEQELSDSNGLAETDGFFRGESNHQPPTTTTNTITVETPRTDSAAPPPATPGPDPDRIDPAAVIFGQGLRWLVQASGKTEAACRPILGRWRRDFGDAVLITALGIAQREAPIEPIAFITATLKRERTTHGTQGRHQDRRQGQSADSRHASMFAAIRDLGARGSGRDDGMEPTDLADRGEDAAGVAADLGDDDDTGR